MRQGKKYLALLTTFSLGVICFVCTTAPTASAMSIPGLSQAPTLSVAPQFPTANSVVAVSIAAPGLGNDGIKVKWSIDSIAADTFENQRTISVQLGDAGKSTIITATLNLGDGSIKKLSKTIIPGSIDIIVEPDTYAPLGYFGKPLPTALSSMRLVAVPHIYEGGNRIPPEQLVFTWQINNTTLFGGPILGRNTATAQMPQFGDANVTVTASKYAGNTTARNSVVVKADTPYLAFYEVSTLFGTVLYSPKSFIAPKDEVVMRAEPYNLSRSALQNINMDFSWTVDGGKVSNPSVDPRSITLRRTAGSPQAEIGFTFSSGGDVLQYGNGSFDILFTEEGFVSL